MSEVVPPAEPTSEPRRRSRWPLAATFGLAGSLCAHGSIMVVTFLFLRGGTAGGGGEGGKAGAGDTTIDVSLAGPASTETAPPTTAEATPPPPPTAPPPPAPTTPPPPDPDPTAATDPTPVPTAVPSEPPPAATAAPVAGGGAETTSGGKLPGAPTLVPGAAGLGQTVEGQRALLPSAVTCKDPVTGTWEALKYAPGKGDWVRFTLTVRRTNSFLSGTILAHTWSGGPLDRIPPACSPGNFDLLVSMPASGFDDGKGRINFGASHFVILQSRCYSPDSTYSPDNFSGTIDPARQEFQSVNNDGATDIDAPYVFRRVGCLDP